MRLSVVIAALLLSACSSGSGRFDRDRSEPSASPRVLQPGQSAPKGGGRYKLGRPYVIFGQRYVPRHEPDYDRTGIASWYGADFQGRLTANGEVYDMNRLTAAHPTLPMPSLVEVTNLDNGRSLILRVNDRGPYARGRIIDLSRRAADLLGLLRAGTGPVRIRYIGPAPLDGNDDVEERFARENGPRRISRNGEHW